MRRTTLALTTASLLSLVDNAQAQKPAAKAEPPQRSEVTTLSQTPEMWFYEQQLRRYEDPRAAVREKAEFRAHQRQQRLAALEWYGFSNSRPRANPTPWGSTYSPQWVGSGGQPFSWSGARQAVVAPSGGSYSR